MFQVSGPSWGIDYELGELLIEYVFDPVCLPHLEKIEGFDFPIGDEGSIG